MKTLYKLILLLLAGTVYGQSQLPTCRGSDTSKWSNCVGTVPDTNGDKYVGEFKDGEASGHGTYTYAYGGKYVGEWKNDAINGQGTYTDANGEYVGEWKNAKRDGQGTNTWVDGTKYVGEWKDDAINGQGTYTHANGKYVGEFKDSTRNGRSISYNANGSIEESGIYKEDKLVTSQYIDPNSFTRIARSSTAPVVSDAQRQENERKAAQLEKDRRRLEEEKRQIAPDGSLEQRYETIQKAGSQYDSIRLRSVSEGSVYKCGQLAYNFLEGYVFIYADEPQTEFLPQTRYTGNDNYVRWEFENGTFTRGGVEYRNPPVQMEFNKKALTLVQSDGSRMVKIPCQAVDLLADVQRRKAAASERDKNLGPGRWVDLGGGMWEWKGRDGINISGRPLKEGMISGFIDDSWDYSLGKKK